MHTPVPPTLPPPTPETRYDAFSAALAPVGMLCHLLHVLATVPEDTEQSDRWPPIAGHLADLADTAWRGLTDWYDAHDAG